MVKKLRKLQLEMLPDIPECFEKIELGGKGTLTVESASAVPDALVDRMVEAIFDVVDTVEEAMKSEIEDVAERVDDMEGEGPEAREEAAKMVRALNATLRKLVVKVQSNGQMVAANIAKNEPRASKDLKAVFNARIKLENLELSEAILKGIASGGGTGKTPWVGLFKSMVDTGNEVLEDAAGEKKLRKLCFKAIANFEVALTKKTEDFLRTIPGDEKAKAERVEKSWPSVCNMVKSPRAKAETSLKRYTTHCMRMQKSIIKLKKKIVKVEGAAKKCDIKQVELRLAANTRALKVALKKVDTAMDEKFDFAGNTSQQLDATLDTAFAKKFAKKRSLEIGEDIYKVSAKNEPLKLLTELLPDMVDAAAELAGGGGDED